MAGDWNRDWRLHRIDNVAQSRRSQEAIMKCNPMNAGVGVALGAGIGAAVGVALGHVGSWIAIGAGIGVAIAYSCAPKSRQDPAPKV